MHIIEQFTTGKRGAELNEDGIFCSESFAAVIDGSTSKVQVQYDKLSKGQMATRIVKEALAQAAAELTMPQMLEWLTGALREACPEALDRDAAYRLTCSCAIVSLRRKELWLIGDCQARMGGHNYTHPKRIDTVLAQIRSDIDTFLLRHGHSVEDIRSKGDPGRKFILDALREQCSFQNGDNPHNPFAYPVLDGTPVSPGLVPVTPIGTNVNEVVLASDGYPRLFDTLLCTEQHLQRLLQADPLCINENRQTKGCMQEGTSYDDRTYLRFSLN